jgi:hypothetical protein
MATFDGTLSNSMKLEGCDALVASLQSLPVAIRSKHLKNAISKALPPMHAALLANTPQGPTGNLRAAVGSEAIYYKSGVAFGIVGYRRAVSVADQLGYHSHLIEFGTNDRVGEREGAPPPERLRRASTAALAGFPAKRMSASCKTTLSLSPPRWSKSMGDQS